jgi:hypothetical protein
MKMPKVKIGKGPAVEVFRMRGKRPTRWACMQVVGSTMMVGAMPNVSGTAAETNVKGKYLEGMGNIASAFPTVGKVVGTTVVLKQVKKLNVPLKMKGGKKKLW